MLQDGLHRADLCSFREFSNAYIMLCCVEEVDFKRLIHHTLLNFSTEHVLIILSYLCLVCKHSHRATERRNVGARRTARLRASADLHLCAQTLIRGTVQIKTSSCMSVVNLWKLSSSSFFWDFSAVGAVTWLPPCLLCFMRVCKAGP